MQRISRPAIHRDAGGDAYPHPSACQTLVAINNAQQQIITRRAGSYDALQLKATQRRATHYGIYYESHNALAI